MKNTIWIVTHEFEWASGFFWYPRREDADAAFDQECANWVKEKGAKVRLYMYETDLDLVADRDEVTAQVETEDCSGALENREAIRSWDGPIPATETDAPAGEKRHFIVTVIPYEYERWNEAIHNEETVWHVHATAEDVKAFCGKLWDHYAHVAEYNRIHHYCNNLEPYTIRQEVYGIEDPDHTTWWVDRDGDFNDDREPFREFQITMHPLQIHEADELDGILAGLKSKYQDDNAFLDSLKAA